MSRDTLSDVLRAVRLRGAVFYYIEGIAPWVADVPPAREILPGIMPGVDRLIEFHGVVNGSCWGGIAGETPARLLTHDVILFPQGDPHVISSVPGLRAPRVERQVYFAPRPPQLPYALSMSGADVTIAPAHSGGSGRTTIVCGFLGLDAGPFNPLLDALPRVLHVSGESLGPDSWVTGFLRVSAAESHQRRPGGEAVLERMSELLFVEVLRHYAAALPTGHTGWLAATQDPSIGRVLGLLHEKPDAPWTLDRLAAYAAMSRSTLHDRFVHFLGQPPMQYLTRWRMQLAASLLRESKAKIVEVALRVGYESEAAFSRAFKRSVGVAPGEWRSGKRTPEDAAAT